MADWSHAGWRRAGARGTTARLDELDLHIEEVANRIGSNKRSQTVSFSVEKPSAELVDYLKVLESARETEASAVETINEDRVGFSHGRAVPE